MIEKDTIVVFTARSPERLVKEGGSQAWILNPARAKRCKWLVCTQNCHNPDHKFSDATEPHGSAFLVGKISVITQSQEEGGENRWLIGISEVARISKSNAWKHWRNPVRYVSLSDLEISVDDLEFQPLVRGHGRWWSSAAAAPETAADTSARPLEAQAGPESQATTWPPATLTILEAKRALAATFGVKPDAVEITIRG